MWIPQICWKLKNRFIHASKQHPNFSWNDCPRKWKLLFKKVQYVVYTETNKKTSVYDKNNTSFHPCLIYSTIVSNTILLGFIKCLSIRMKASMYLSKSFSASMQALQEMQVAMVMLPFFWVYRNRSWLVQTLGYNYISEWAVEPGNFN